MHGDDAAGGLPDGLLQVFLGSDPKPNHALIEIATYPERRALKQAMDDPNMSSYINNLMRKEIAQAIPCDADPAEAG